MSLVSERCGAGQWRIGCPRLVWLSELGFTLGSLSDPWKVLNKLAFRNFLLPTDKRALGALPSGGLSRQKSITVGARGEAVSLAAAENRACGVGVREGAELSNGALWPL